MIPQSTGEIHKKPPKVQWFDGRGKKAYNKQNQQCHGGNDMDYTSLLASEFSLRPQQVQAAVELLDAGNTIPFIARYRK